MPWWGWLVVGIGLLAVEMFVVDAQFYLVFIGVSAVIVGALVGVGVLVPEWSQWLVFSIVALLTMFTFRSRVYGLVRGRGAAGVPERITPGDRVRVPVRLEPGQICRVDYRGSTWTARNADRTAIEADSEALISRADDLTLHLVAVSRQS